MFQITDERVDAGTRGRWATMSEEQVAKQFYDDFMDPWCDWHDPEHWAMLERIVLIVERLRQK